MTRLTLNLSKAEGNTRTVFRHSVSSLAAFKRGTVELHSGTVARHAVFTTSKALPGRTLTAVARCWWIGQQVEKPKA